MALHVVICLLIATSFASASSTASKRLSECVARVFRGSNPYERMVLPSNDTYTDARLGETARNDQFPALIAYATSGHEVAALVRCAVSTGYRAVPRSGGHHFAGYSVYTDTLAIDLSHIDEVTVSPDATTAKIGAGIRLGALYVALGAHNMSFPGGICPTVGMGGFIGSGGFNMQMRALGLAADYILSATVALANGRTVTASADQNPDLFWAIRGGGGGTYGIVVDFTLRLVQMPRSAMLFMTWADSDNIFKVAKTFLQWGPRAPKDFTSQVNVYRDNVTVLGWYLGASKAQLESLVNESGLLHIGKPKVIMSGGCNTDNSRLFGYTNFACVPDDQVDIQLLNVLQQPFSQWENKPQFTLDEAPKSTSIPVAPPWTRWLRMSKSFFVTKDKQMSDDTLRGIIKRVRSIDPAAGVWGEWHAWNLSGETGDNAFAWREKAYAHLEFRVSASTNQSRQESFVDWFADLESYLRPKLGPASYAGYIDANISTDPLESYYGSNVCRLSSIKKRYDPQDFFRNPDTIPPVAPSSFRCPQ